MRKKNNPLKPCPFCGNNPSETSRSCDRGWISTIRCVPCGVEMVFTADTIKDSEGGVTNRWNERIV